MSSKQLDSNHDIQERFVQAFGDLLQEFDSGLVTYDDVEDALVELKDDEECAPQTLDRCIKEWEQKVHDEEFWQEEDRQMWEQLQKDS